MKNTFNARIASQALTDLFCFQVLMKTCSFSRSYFSLLGSPSLVGGRGGGRTGIKELRN